MNTLPAHYFQIQTATLAARARTGDKTIGTHAGKGGLYQLIRVTYDKAGKSTVVPFTEWLSPDDAVNALEALR